MLTFLQSPPLGEKWQEEEVDSCYHKECKDQARREKHPEFEAIVEVAAVVNALDQIRAGNGHLQDLARMRVDLYFPAILNSDFNHTLAWPHVEAIDVIPGRDGSLGDSFCHLQDAIEADRKLGTGSRPGRRLNVLVSLSSLTTILAERPFKSSTSHESQNGSLR